MTYQWWVGACNELTQDNLDPISKTPETKYCAVKVEAIADQQWAERYAWTAYSDMKARLKAAADADLRERSALPLPLPVGYAAGSCFSTSPTHMATPGPISASLKS